MCFRGALLDKEFRHFVYAQTLLLWLYALNYISSLAWLAAVSREPMSQSDDDDSETDTEMLWQLWAYTGIVCGVAFLAVYALTRLRSRILIEQEEQKQIIDEEAHKEADSEVQAEDGPTKIVEAKTDEPQSEEETAKEDQRKVRLFQKIIEKRKKKWAERKVFRQKWLDKVTDMLGDALVFMAASAFSSAIQYTLPQSQEHYVISSWMFAGGLTVVCSLIQTLVTDCGREREAETKQEETEDIGNTFTKRLLSVPQFAREKLFADKVRTAVFATMAGYLQYTQAYIMALAYTNAVLYTIQQYVDESDDHMRSTILTWLYAVVLMVFVSLVLLWLDRAGIRKKLTGQESFPHRYWHEVVDLSAATLHLMAAFAIPFGVELTLENASSSDDMWVLFGYAVGVSIAASLVITKVQMMLGEAREREIENRKKEAVTQLEGPSVNEDGDGQIQKKRFGWRVRRAYDKVPLGTWLSSYQFQHNAAKIIRRGLGLTVALAWDSLLVRFVINQEGDFGYWAMWVYALSVTLFTSILIIYASTSTWMEQTQKGDAEAEGEHEEGAEGLVNRVKSWKKKPKIPGLAFQGGDEDDLLDEVS